MKLVTMKFGGTSVGSAEAIRGAVQIIHDTCESEAERVVVVVSAMSGVTNLLQEGVVRAANGDPERSTAIAQIIRDKHEEAASDLLAELPTEDRGAVLAEIDGIVEDYRRFCESIGVLGEATPRALDATMGMGERMSARLVAGAIRGMGMAAQPVDATELIVTDTNFQSAAPLMDETRIKTRERLGALISNGIVPIVTGFIGATLDGRATTLGRGGSDYSAAILGAALGSDEVWIWTDVDGVMSADPRVVPDARILDTLSYREISELAYFGAKVLHPKTIRPVLEAGIALRVKNTFNPAHPGTQIVETNGVTSRPIKAVTAIRDLSLITVEGKGMLGVPGIAARTFGAVARTGTSVLMISQSSSEQSICFVVPLTTADSVIEAVNREFEAEIGRRDIDEVFSQDEVGIVTVVGGGMREVPGVAGKIFSATGADEVNVIAITQGSSECSISLVVASADVDRAVHAIHPLTMTD